MVKRLLLINILMLFLGCSKNKDFVPVYNVPAEFQPLVTTFIQEAAQRGNSIAINNLIIKYDTTLDVSYCALCNTLSLEPDIQKIIAVNPKIHCYNNDKERETLFFHELGHCILGRSHNNERLPNGDPKSIMVEKNLSLYSPCSYAIGGACKDNTFKRTYYLDELFDEHTPVPQWAK